jgi:dihydrofolate synthase/folylpolyglutamate synthase
MAGTDARWRLGPDGRTRLDLRTPVTDYGSITLSLRGAHQVANAVVAVRALEALAGVGLCLTREAIVAGLSEASWPGRLDLRALDDGRSVLLDAAHNPAGAATLASYLREAGLAPLPVVFGVVRDKDCDAMLRALAPVATHLFVTEPPTRRARPAEDVAARAREMGLAVPVTVVGPPGQALRAAWARAARVCVAGSIFLVGDVIRTLACDAGAGA